MITAGMEFEDTEVEFEDTELDFYGGEFEEAIEMLKSAFRRSG